MTRKFWKRTEPVDHTEWDHTEPDHAEPDHAELARLLPAPSVPPMPLDRQLLFEEHLLNEIRTPAPAPEPTARPVRRALLIAVPVTAVALAAVFTVGALTSGGTDGRTGADAVAAPVVAVEE
ncbi:hypothetical protein AB0P12_10595, partial [Streptomyces subrutilus]